MKTLMTNRKILNTVSSYALLFLGLYILIFKDYWLGLTICIYVKVNDIHEDLRDHINKDSK